MYVIILNNDVAAIYKVNTILRGMHMHHGIMGRCIQMASNSVEIFPVLIMQLRIDMPLFIPKAIPSITIKKFTFSNTMLLLEFIDH